jgi:hypothetical protein
MELYTAIQGNVGRGSGRLCDLVCPFILNVARLLF